MLTSIRNCLKELLLEPSCAICKRRTQREKDQPDLCEACRHRFGLTEAALKGTSPLPWRAASWYEGDMCGLILSLRRDQNFNVLRALCTVLQLDLPRQILLVPIPGWKSRNRANPLPELMCRCLERQSMQLLQRCRPTVGQHRLNRRQRVSNQCNSFGLRPSSTQEPMHPGATPPNEEVWLVDDIVTTGATVLAAQQALLSAGIAVQGVLCLARTSRGVPPRDLRFECRVDNAPG